jgi:pilus assembly protein CpaF
MSLLKRIERSQEPTGDERVSKLQELRVKRTSPATGSRDAFVDLKNRIQQKLIAELDPSIDIRQTTEVRVTIQEMFETMLADEQIVLSRNEKRALFEQIVAEILGYGPLEKYLSIDGITEIMVNVMRIIDRIVAPLGRRIDEGSPMVDARLPDGSRVNAVIPPLALKGPHHHPQVLQGPRSPDDNLINFGSITPT